MPKKKKSPTTPTPDPSDQVREITSIRQLPACFRMWEKVESALATGKIVYYYKAPVGNYHIIATEEALT